MSTPFHDAFAVALGHDGPLIGGWRSALDEALRSIARDLPDLPHPDAAFAAHVAAKLDKDREPSVALDAIAIPDLYLAFACGQGDAKALAELDRRYGQELELALRRARNTGVEPEDLRQRLLERLLVASPGQAPRILGYSGRGGLRAWLRITTTRLVINAARDHGRRPASRSADVELLERIAVDRAAEDPELAYLREHHRTALSDALVAAFASLSPRERNVLRHSVLHEISSQRLGELYGVHRATALRWRQDVVKKMLGAVRASLRANLHLDGPELESMLRGIESRLDLSVRRLLGPEAEPEPGR